MSHYEETQLFYNSLTVTEKKVLKEVAEGKSSSRIASNLSISTKMVVHHTFGLTSKYIDYFLVEDPHAVNLRVLLANTYWEIQRVDEITQKISPPK